MQAQSPLRSPVCVDHSMGAHTYVAQVVLSVKRVCNLCLHHNHQVIVPELHGPGGWGGGQSHGCTGCCKFQCLALGLGQTVTQQQRWRVEPVAKMADREGEADRYYAGPSHPLTRGDQNP